MTHTEEKKLARKFKGNFCTCSIPKKHQHFIDAVAIPTKHYVFITYGQMMLFQQERDSK